MRWAGTELHHKVLGNAIVLSITKTNADVFVWVSTRAYGKRLIPATHFGDGTVDRLRLKIPQPKLDWHSGYEAIRFIADDSYEPVSGVYWCFDYQPRRRSRGFNPLFDEASQRLLDLKAGDATAIGWYYRHLKKLLVHNHEFAIVVVPSSNPGNSVSGIKLLAHRLVQGNAARLDALACLARYHAIEAVHKSGIRSIEQHRNSIRVEHKDIIYCRPVLLIDDITTTGNSFIACKEILLEAGAAVVECLALGRTVR